MKVSIGSNTTCAVAAIALLLTAFDPATAYAGGKKALGIGLGVAAGVATGVIIHKSLKNKRKSRYRATSRKHRNYRSPTRSSSRFDQNVHDVQSALAALGFHKGAIDGITGRQTRASISRFQESQGAPATGRLSSGQQAQLFALAYGTPGTSGGAPGAQQPGFFPQGQQPAFAPQGQQPQFAPSSQPLFAAQPQQPQHYGVQPQYQGNGHNQVQPFNGQPQQPWTGQGQQQFAVQPQPGAPNQGSQFGSQPQHFGVQPQHQWNGQNPPQHFNGQPQQPWQGQSKQFAVQPQQQFPGQNPPPQYGAQPQQPWSGQAQQQQFTVQPQPQWDGRNQPQHAASGSQMPAANFNGASTNNQSGVNQPAQAVQPVAQPDPEDLASAFIEPTAQPAPTVSSQANSN